MDVRIGVHWNLIDFEISFEGPDDIFSMEAS